MIRLKDILLEDTNISNCELNGRVQFIKAIEYWETRLSDPKFREKYAKAHGGEIFPDTTSDTSFRGGTGGFKLYQPPILPQFKNDKPSAPGITPMEVTRDINKYKSILVSFKSDKTLFKVVSGVKVHGDADRSLGAAWYTPSDKTITINCTVKNGIMGTLIHELTHALYDQGGPLNPIESWQKFATAIYDSHTKTPAADRTYKHIEYNDIDLTKKFGNNSMNVKKIIEYYNKLDDPNSFNFKFFKKYRDKNHNYALMQTEMIARLAELRSQMDNPNADITVHIFENWLEKFPSDNTKFFLMGWISSWPDVDTIAVTVKNLNNIVAKINKPGKESGEGIT